MHNAVALWDCGESRVRGIRSSRVANQVTCAPPSSPARQTSLMRDHFRDDAIGGSLALSAGAHTLYSLLRLRAVPALTSVSRRIMACVSGSGHARSS